MNQSNVLNYSIIYSRRLWKKSRKTCLFVSSICCAVACSLFVSELLEAKPFYNKREFIVDREIVPMKELWKSIYLNESNQLVLHDKRAYSTIYSTIGSSKHIIPELNKLDSVRIQNRKREVLNKLPAQKRQIVEENMKLSKGQIERFKRSVVRSGRYLPEFKRIFRSYGLPEELVYLPHVESSFTIKAVSSAGASGLWQFMPSTARQYGLKIDAHIDERYDPYLACDAAARLLRDNYMTLGSWPLAITAYNHGAAGMKKASEQYDSFGKIVHNYKSKSFGFYSKNYYSQFLASVEVAKLLEGHLKHQMLTPEKLDLYVVEDPTSVESLLIRNKLSADDFYTLNPALKNKNRKFVLPKGSRIHLKKMKV